METRQRLNQRRKLKAKEKRIIIKTLSPCYGTFKCAIPDKYSETEYKSPVDCPVGIDCVEKFTKDYIAEELNINPDLLRTVKHLRKMLTKNLKHIYFSQARESKT